MHELVLASTSRYRRELLARLRLPFTCVAPVVDEDPREGESGHALAVRLAEAKARAGAAGRDTGLVIGSDQVAVNGGRLLGKPGTRANALQQLLAASARTVEFHTAVCLLDAASMQCRSETVTTRVCFRALDRQSITAYLDAEQPYDCAGSFKAEGLGIVLFERIEGDDPTALTGLPLIALTSLLHAAGCAVLRCLPSQP